MGSTGVEVNAILLIIGSLSQLLTMTKTNRGGSVVGRRGAGQQQVEVGFCYRGAGLSRALQDMKEALWAARIPFNTRRLCRGKKLRPGTFVPLFMFSSVLLGVYR